MPDHTLRFSTVKAVIFDVDGTLYQQTPLRRAMAVRLVRAHLLHPVRGLRTARALAGYRRAQEELRDVVADSDLTEAQLSLAAQRSGVHRDHVASSVARWMEAGPLDLLVRFAQPGMVETLRELRDGGIRLAVLSDYPAAAKLLALGIADLFDVVLCAQQPEIGVFKPHPRGLHVALQRLGVEASEALYVGDRAEIDAVAAAAANVPCLILAKSWRDDDGAEFLRTTSFREMTQILEPT